MQQRAQLLRRVQAIIQPNRFPVREPSVTILKTLPNNLHHNKTPTLFMSLPPDESEWDYHNRPPRHLTDITDWLKVTPRYQFQTIYITAPLP